MRLLTLSALKVNYIKKALLFVLGIVVLAFVGYEIGKHPQWFTGMKEKFPAALSPVTTPSPSPELPPTTITPEITAQLSSYTEKAQPGEGLTHLARRVLARYLKDHPQNIQLTPEHKIFIEDYLAKALGGRWLKVGEEVDFSVNLIQEAINRAQSLTPAQLQNLSQYVPLVPSLAT
jgi:hypothetical protein